jgi:hypothetical protein
LAAGHSRAASADKAPASINLINFTGDRAVGATAIAFVDLDLVGFHAKTRRREGYGAYASVIASAAKRSAPGLEQSIVTVGWIASPLRGSQ